MFMTRSPNPRSKSNPSGKPKKRVQHFNFFSFQTDQGLYSLGFGRSLGDILPTSLPELTMLRDFRNNQKSLTDNFVFHIRQIAHSMGRYNLLKGETDGRTEGRTDGRKEQPSADKLHQTKVINGKSKPIKNINVDGRSSMNGRNVA